MSDKTKKRWKLAADILTLLSGLAGILAVAKQLPVYMVGPAALAASMFGYASRWCEKRLPPTAGPAAAKIAGAGAALLGLLLVGGASACGPSPAVVATHGTMRATQLAGDTVAAVHKAGKADCAHVKRWRTHGRQAVRVAIAGSVVAIRAAKGGKVDWMAALKPGACELFRWLDAAAGDAPADAAKAMAYLGAFKGLVCPKRASAVDVLAIVLPVAQALIEWLQGLVGASDDKLLAEVDAYLAAPAKDATDSICLE
jgi:hypothetical protein